MAVTIHKLLSLFFLWYTLLRFDFFVLSFKKKRPDISPLSIDRSLSFNGVTPQNILLLNEKAPNRAPKWGGTGKVGENCVVKETRLYLYVVLKWWIEFAAIHNVQWWLCFGSLLGQHWYQDELPWDTDFDIQILGADEWKVRHYQHPRSQTLRNKDWDCSLIARPGNGCHGTMKSCDENSESCKDAPMGVGFRRSCEGNQVNSHVDSCAFCGPMGRVIRHSRMDLYSVHLVEINGTLKWYDDNVAEYTAYFDDAYYNYDDIAPLQLCVMMGLRVPCPNRPKKLLMAMYSSDGLQGDTDKFDEEITPRDNSCKLINHIRP